MYAADTDASKDNAAYLDIAFVRLHEEGLTNHLQVGQGRDEDLLLVGILEMQ